MRLWRFLIAFGFVLNVANVSLAQVKMELGAKAGLNYSSLNLSKDGKLNATTLYHYAVGYHFGGYAVFKFAKYSIQPEVLYSTQGHYFTTPYYSNLKTTLNYINIPVLLKYYLTGSLNVQIGPQLGLLVGSKGDLSQINGGYIVGSPIFNQKLKDYVKSTDFSIALGAGINFTPRVNVNVRYTIGINDINKNTGSTTPFPGGLQPSISTAYTRNQVFQVSVGYQLRKLGK